MGWREELLNGLQAASNAVAGNVSGPVDLINAGLGLLGVPVSQEPFGGSAWMAQRGLTRPVRPGASQVVGETAGLLGPTLTAAYAPQIARGLLAAGDAMPAASTGAKFAPSQEGKIVWHGSPHKFDRFDAGKIGTGEGVSAFGIGHYAADSRGVAESYRGALSKFNVPDGPEKGIATLIAARGDQGEKLARQAYANLGDELEPTIRRAKQLVDSSSFLYKIDLADDAIPKMIDWDKPIAEDVRKRVSEAAMQKFGSGSSGSSGRNLYQELAQEFKWQGSKNPSADVAEFLRQQGVPGIRYLDAGSRGSTEGTYNYVVFPGNEGLLSILERNGLPVK